MQGKELTRIFDNTASLPSEDIKRLFEMLAESGKEKEITKREIKKYESIRDVMIKEINGRYQFYDFFFSKFFAERSEAIKKDFEIIDKGMNENNRDLISMGVAGLSQVVASSPFTDLEKLRKMIESMEKL